MGEVIQFPPRELALFHAERLLLMEATRLLLAEIDKAKQEARR